MLATSCFAAGTTGLMYDTYVGGGASPLLSFNANGVLINRTKLSSGTTSTINYNWGGGGVLTSGRGDGVIVHFYGYINIPTAGNYTFGGNADDGIIIKVNNTTVVDSWIESGGSFRSGVVTLPSGTVAIELWYYENGGGALVNLQWYTSSGWQIVPSASLATDSSYWVQTLCCNASAVPFNANSINTAKSQEFLNRTTQDSKIKIEQIGSFNNITVQQSGTKNNYVNYYSTGNSNTTNVSQSGVVGTQSNYVDINLAGSNNSTTISQQSTGGSKSIFITETQNTNTVNATQTGSGSHYLDISLSGGNKSVTTLQEGSANHMASITLSGNPVSINTIQSGTTQQYYSINFNCATSGGCSPITVTQGR